MKESFNNPDNNKENSRRNFIKKMSILAAGLMIKPKALFSESVESNEQNRIVEKVGMEEMENQGNLPDGFSRSRINIKFQGEKEIMGAGSFFSMEDTNKAKTELVSAAKHPELFSKGVNFDAIEKHYKNEGKKVALVVAGAYYAPGTNDIEGIVLEKGQMVGQDNLKQGSNGFLVIKDGNPEIQYINQIPDFNNYLEDLKNQNADAFQQTSYIRPGGNFTSSNPKKWELRFFVEGEENGKQKKGIINFSTAMTYTEAVDAMKKIEGLTVNKAIGLDTGNMSEGYFYDKVNGKNLMIDEQVGTHRNEYTNVLVMFSE